MLSISGANQLLNKMYKFIKIYFLEYESVMPLTLIYQEYSFIMFLYKKIVYSQIYMYMRLNMTYGWVIAWGRYEGLCEINIYIYIRELGRLIL